MDTVSVAALLKPFLGADSLSEAQVKQVAAYLELLVRWNAKTNLTAVRQPEEMVTRHFGESFFASAHLLRQQIPRTAIDLGSGAGFPGLPFVIFAPEVTVTLIESQNKKATFLKEVVRSLGLRNVSVVDKRSESFAARADLVMMRAVERFADSVSEAQRLVSPGGRLALLIGAGQVNEAFHVVDKGIFEEPVPIPQSQTRVLLVGKVRSE
ncbi:MAG TPA: 16S rRNA (guanine(527)-N(7))-methyltransferase RsmG [Terriglobales bacterium]|nr:16S rRNA (guanine(527)-N(7))-methyltransferase RsmG [Terriglobales bacterium]